MVHTTQLKNTIQSSSLSSCQFSPEHKESHIIKLYPNTCNLQHKPSKHIMKKNRFTKSLYKHIIVIEGSREVEIDDDHKLKIRSTTEREKRELFYLFAVITNEEIPRRRREKGVKILGISAVNFLCDIGHGLYGNRS